MTERFIPKARTIALATAGVFALITAMATATMTTAAEAGGGSSQDVCAVAAAAHGLICPSPANTAQQTASKAMTDAVDKAIWQLQTDSAYLTVYAHYCVPDVRHLAAMLGDAPSIEVALYTDRFRVEYGGDCQAFYLNEIAARIDAITEQAG